MKNKSAIVYIILLITFGIASFGIPQYFLEEMQSSNVFVVQHGENTYYGEDISYEDSVGAAGTQLDFKDKLRLINNQDQLSRQIIEEPEEGVLSLREAAVTAKERLLTLYVLGLTPVNIEGGIDNWYTYQGTLYEYRDKIFGRNNVQVWVIEYIAYDDSIHVETTMDAQTGAIYIVNVIAKNARLDTDIVNSTIKNTMEEALTEGIYILLAERSLNAAETEIETEAGPDAEGDIQDFETAKVYEKEMQAEISGGYGQRSTTDSSLQKYTYQGQLASNVFVFIDELSGEEYYMVIDNQAEVFRILFEVPSGSVYEN